MSSMIEQAFDDMELEEVLCRLPSKFAIGSLKRRTKDINDLKEFMSARDAGGASKVKEIVEHVNSIVTNTNIDKIFKTFSSQYHPTLFGWLNSDNKKNILENGKDGLSIEFIFNLTDSKDFNGMGYILDRVLKEPEPNVSKITAILNKIDVEIFQEIMEKVIKDNRPKVRSSILSVHNDAGVNTISDHQKMIALKAFAKIPASDTGSRYIQPIDFKLFKNLKPLERIMALDRYLSYFSLYSKRAVFDPAPSDEELDLILFAGCFEFNDIVEGIKKKYNAITKDDEPCESSKSSS